MAQDVDPISARQSAVSATPAECLVRKTFAQVVEQYIEQHRTLRKNQMHSPQSTVTLQTYANPVIDALLVRDITVVHIIRILEPIGASKFETATQQWQRSRRTTFRLRLNRRDTSRS